MGNKNYTKYSDNSNNDNKHIVNPELEQTVLNAGGEVMRIDQENIIVEGANELPKDVNVLDNVILPGDAVLKGVVNTSRLNVRKFPNKNAQVLQIITLDSEVEIRLDGETDEFYKVRTKSGVEGYCMKEFINIK